MEFGAINITTSTIPVFTGLTQGIITAHQLLTDNQTITNAVNTLSQSDVAAWGGLGMLWSVIQWVLFIVGTLGNLLVVLVLLWRRSRSQLVTQLFIGSLSMSGLALMFASAWIQALLYIDSNWKYGKTSCQIQFYVQANMIFISIWTLASVAFERFAFVVKLSHNRPKSLVLTLN